jgi:hypothetical protein
MTNDEGLKPEGAPERSPWRRRPFGRRWQCPEALFRSAQNGGRRTIVGALRSPCQLRISPVDPFQHISHLGR